MVVLNQTIKAKANQRNKTFTLRTYVNGKFSAKYRTTPMSRAEFESCCNNTQNDWRNFLQTDNYYKV